MSVTIHLCGGLGNQLFQYATGLSLATKLGTDLKLDVSRFDNPGEFRMYSLGLFKGVTEAQVREMYGLTITENGLPFNENLFTDVPKDVCIYGYFQTEKYFSEMRDELLARLVPSTPLPSFSMDMLQNIEREGDRSVFLTVRRTDYVGNSFHGLLPMSYYEQAADIIASKVPSPCFYVFSDDPPWCVNNFKLPYPMVMAGNYDRTVPAHLGREDAELWLMSKCRHAILANSTYSWWGAWLNPRTDGIVIGPKNWFGPTSTENPCDIIPQRWVTL